MVLHLPGTSKWFAEWKERIQQYSTVIIFEELPTECIIKFVRKKNPKCRIIYWYWNTVRFTPKNRNMAEYWSFDYNDCEKYNLQFNNQFGFIIGSREKKSGANVDVFFIGSDKGRYSILKKIEKELNDKHIYTEFLIVKDKHTIKNSRCIDKMLPYEKVIKEVKNARCLLDIVKEGQSGMTLRFVEAAFYKKKVITNNKFVKQHPLYNKDWVFILGEDNWNDIKEFINKETISISDNQLYDYTYQGWLNKFGITKLGRE